MKKSNIFNLSWGKLTHMASTLNQNHVYRHTWVRFPGTGLMVKMWHFFIFLKLFCDLPVRSFQLLRFCLLDSKNVFVLVLAQCNILAIFPVLGKLTHIGLTSSFGALLVGWLVVVARGLYLARHLFTL